LADAEALCRKILAADANCVEALRLLASIAAGAGKPDAVVELLSRAASLRPADLSLRNDLANALLQSGRRDEAIGRYREALAIKSDWVEMLYNLVGALCAKGDY